MRLGVQEMTHCGMKEEEFNIIAEFFERLIIKGESADKIKQEVNSLRSKFLSVKFSFDEEEMN
jgi:glycine hydroxymethyltransferase